MMMTMMMMVMVMVMMTMTMMMMVVMMMVVMMMMMMMFFMINNPVVLDHFTLLLSASSACSVTIGLANETASSSSPVIALLSTVPMSNPCHRIPSPSDETCRGTWARVTIQRF
jgi:hypothetical protein